MQVAAFFHCYAAGEWREPTFEFLDALDESGFDGALFVGLLGSPERRAEAIAAIRERRSAEVAAEAEAGGLRSGPWEEVTLVALHDYAKRNDGAVVYAHTKGSSYRERGLGADAPEPQSDWNRVLYEPLSAIRRRALDHLVLRRSIWLDAFASGEWDVAGLAWGHTVRSGVTRNPLEPNFWATTCGWARQLPPCEGTRRGCAQEWIVSRGPRALQLGPEVNEAGLIETLAQGFGEDFKRNLPRLCKPDAGATLTDQLDRLADLRERRLLSAAEFRAAKSKLLAHDTEGSQPLAAVAA